MSNSHLFKRHVKIIDKIQVEIVDVVKNELTQIFYLQT